MGIVCDPVCVAQAVILYCIAHPQARADSSASFRSMALVAIALLALVLRLLYVHQISNAPFATLRIGDAEAYHDWAVRIASGHWLGDGVFYQAPLYPYFLAVIYKVFGDSVAMVRFIHAVIGTGSCVLLASAGMALFGRRGAVAGGLLAAYPAAIFLDGLLDKSALVTFLMVALLYFLASGRGGRQAFLTGVALGLLSLARENALLLALPVFAWLLIGDRRPTDSAGERLRRPLAAAAACLAGCAIVLLPVGARNYAVGGEFHLTTSQFGPNFYIGNHPGARGLYDALVSGHGSASDERDDATQLAEEAAGRHLTPSEVSSYWTSRAFEFIRTQPGAWVRQLARKLALTYNSVEIADTESQDVYAEWSPLLRVLSRFDFGVIACLAAFGACMTASAWRRLWFLYAIALTYTLSVVAFYVFARYRFPLVPVLLLLGAGGVAAWREPGARPMRRWAIAALVAAGIVSNVPLVNTRVDRIVNYVNIADVFLRNPKTWDQASVFYQKALDESPRSPAANLGIGMLLAEQGRPGDAIPHYVTAVAGWPDNAELRLNLAIALANTGETGRAFDELDAAARLRPGDPTVHVIRGRLLLKASRSDEALASFERALALQPSDQDALIGSCGALMQLQRSDEAIEKCRQAAQVSPGNAEAPTILGRMPSRSRKPS